MLNFPVSSPTLLLDEKICRNNLSRMALKASKHKVKLVPHFKTHQSLEVGKWCKDAGITEITVSSIHMAAYFVPQNWQNIHIAFPFNLLETPLLNKLAEKQALSVQLVNETTAKYLADNLEHEVGFFIEIDAGYGRTGVEVADFGLIEAILRAAGRNKKLRFKGFYIHAGHTYHANQEEIHRIHQQTKSALQMLKDKYSSEFPDLVTRSGDTPSCSIMDDFEGIDEIGPGNFVFYDLTQAQIGSCTKSDIAVALAAPVVDIKKDKKEILVHAGGVHLSKDVLLNGHKKNFGEVALFHKDKWIIPEEVSYLKSISQEHGVIHASPSLMKSIQVGDVIGILPVHSCMTADCMRSYCTMEGKKIDHFEGMAKN